MIKEATNSFSDGIISDVNPINVPNTALTDCVNGTILTYNGNEYSLQNDMGNGKLKSVFLGDGFIPVGMKEYGGILYIVSYNPKEDLTEIGSYPSTKIGLKDSDGNYVYKDIEYINWDEPQKYSDLLKKYDLQVFSKDGEDKDKYKINPGDELKIQQTFFDGDSEVATIETPLFQSPEFYIMDETRNLTGIDEYISEYIENSNKTISELIETKWKIPGWLAVKLNFIKFDNFLTNFELTQLPKFKNENDSSDVKFDLSYRIYMSDGFYNGQESPKITVKVSGLSDEIEILELDNDSLVTLPNGQIYLSTKSTSVTWNAKKGEKLTLTATPYVGNVEYDTYITQYIYTADATVFNPDLLEIGDTTFRWKTTADKLAIEFNTTGAESAVGSTLSYDIYRVDPDSKELSWIPVFENGTVDDWKKVSTITTNLTIPLVEYTENFDKNKDLVAEDVYKFVLKVNYGEETITRERIVTATELMNDIDEQLYYNITLGQWLPNYEKYIKGEWPVITDAGITPQDEINTSCLWFTNINNSPVCKMYKGFVENKDFKYGDTKTITVSQQYIGDINSISEDITFPHGPIWNSINARILLSAERQRVAEYRINKLGKLKLRNKNVFYGSVKNISEYTVNYIGNQDLTCYDYSIINLSQLPIKDSDYYFLFDRVNSRYGFTSSEGNTIVREIYKSDMNKLTGFEIYNRKTGDTVSNEVMKTNLSEIFKTKKIIPICVIYPVYRDTDGIYWSHNNLSFNETSIDNVYPPESRKIFNTMFYKQLLAINTDKYGLFFTNAIDRDAKNSVTGFDPAYVSNDVDKSQLLTIANGVSESINQFYRGNIYTGGFINILKGNTSFNPNIELNIKFQDFRYDFQKYGLKNFESDETVNINIEKTTNYSLDETLFDTDSIATKISELDKVIEEFNSKSLKSSQLRAENSTFYTNNFIEHDTYYFVNNYSGQALSKLENIVKALNGKLSYSEWAHITYMQYHLGNEKWSGDYVYGTCLGETADPILPTDFN